jgi:hypothetical protein
MKIRVRAAAAVAGVLLSLGTGSARAQGGSPAPGATHRESVVTNHASGTFEVKVTPQAPDENGEPSVGRLSLDKQFHGDLEGTSKGQMLAVRSDVEGSAGYVAMERVTGTVAGRTGSFALQHYGIMNRGAPTLTISVVPDSGTGQLAGLAGTMTIDVVEGKHLYALEYTLPAH